MSKKRTCVGIRVLSMLLVVCMVLGMAPLSVFAAETATAELTNLERIQAYAKKLFDANFDNSLDYSGKFTWCTEKAKGHKWTYFDGLMVDAYLAMGMAGDKGSILEFASNYYNTQLTEAGVIRRFGSNATLDKEVDSVPPALGLFDLLGTVADEPKFHTVLHDMYKALQGYDTLTNVGGNFRHKESESWKTYPFALDGIYMALPFLMEYANAVESGKLENTNKIVPSDVRTDVYKRLVWVADHMQDGTTKLYNHGVQEDGTTMNGQFWTRGIGWYAVALVDVIGMMPDGEQKTTLESKLLPLFDGMLKYQHSSGLWYNVTNYTDTTLSGNKLETSGTACMAYALMKAYNNGWVGDAYGKAGLKAINGIVTEKLSADNTTIKDVYKSSGVSTEASYYATNSTYESNEAKGVGAVLLAATQVEKTEQKLAGGAGTLSVAPTGGMVKAPAETISVQVGGQPDLSGVRASIIFDNGSITTVENGEGLTCSVPTAEGAATLDVLYQGKKVGTLNVNVTDPSVASGTVTTTTTTSNTAPAYEDLRWVTVSAGDAAAGSYTLAATASAIQFDTPYVTHAVGNKNRNATVEETNGELAFTSSQQITWKASGDTYTPSETPTTYWYLDSAGHMYTLNSAGIKYYVTSLTALGTDETKAIAFTVQDSADGTYLYYGTSSVRPKGTGLEQKDKTGAGVMEFYAPASGASEYAHLNGQNYTINAGSTTNDALIEKIQRECTLSVSQNSDGSNPTSLAWSAVTTAWDKPLNTAEAGTYTMTVTYKTKTLGQIVVVVNGETSIDHPVVLDIEPNTLALDMNGTKTGTLTAGITVDGTAGTGTVTWTSSDANVATVENGQVKAVGAGTATITAELSDVTIGGNKCTLATPLTASVTVNVTGGSEETTTPTTETTEPTVPDGASLTIKKNDGTEGSTASLTKGGTLQLTVELTGANGGTTTWSTSNKDVATVADGLVTAVGNGTATITAEWRPTAPANAASTLSTRAANSLTATFEVTVEDAAIPDGKTYELYTGELSAITSTDKFLIVDFANPTHALYNNGEGFGGDLTVAISGNKITVATADTANAEWSFNGTATGTSGSFQIVNGEMDIRTGNNEIIRASSNNDTVTVSVTDQSAGKYTVNLGSNNYLFYDANNDRGKGTVWTRSNGSTEYVLLFKEVTTDTPTPPPTPTYSATVSADPTTITVGETSTLTASMSDGTNDITGTATFAWQITKGTGELTGSGNSVTFKGDAAGDVEITVTATAPSGETATAMVTVKVNAADPGPEPAGASTYILDVNGIETGKEYLIVAQAANGQWYALKNVTTKVGSSTYAEALPVTINGQTITIDNESDALLSEWYFSNTSGAMDITNTHNTNTNPVYINLNNVKVLNDSSQAYVTAIDTSKGTYHISKNKDDGSRLVIGDTFTRADSADVATQVMYLYKKSVTTSALSIDKKSVALDLFSTDTLTPTVLYQGTILTSGYTLEWVSGDTNVVTVDQNGKLTAGTTPGKTTVTATLDTVNGVLVEEKDKVSATVEVTLNDLTMPLSQTALSLYLPNGSLQSALQEKKLNAYVRSGGVAVAAGDATVVWSSSNTAVATVDQNGKVTAVGEGTATITAKLTRYKDHNDENGIRSESCTVTVAKNYVTDIQLNPTTIVVGWADETPEQKDERVGKALGKIVATIVCADGRTFNLTLQNLFDRNDSVAKVSSNYSEVVKTDVRQTTEYKVDVSIEGTIKDGGWQRNVTVRVVDPKLLNSDGVVVKDSNVKYKPVTSGKLEDGKEYIIVAFPNGTDKPGIALSNDAMTNPNNAKPDGVEVTVSAVDANGDVTITLPSGTTDSLLKWYFSAQEKGNWYIYNFEHRLSAGDKNNLLQPRVGPSTDDYRLYAKAVDGVTGAFYLTKEDPATGSKHNYVSYSKSAWKRAETSNPDAEQQLYLYERVSDKTDLPVNLIVSPSGIMRLHSGVPGQASAEVLVNGERANTFNLEWSSSDETIAKVDKNSGLITVASTTATGTVQITAKLIHANGTRVIPNEGSYVTKSITVEVVPEDVKYTVVNNEVITRLGGRPNYSSVQVQMTCNVHGDSFFGATNANVELDPLSAVDDPTAKNPKPLNYMVAGTYYVPVTYLDMSVGYVKVIVDPDPYLNLDLTTVYPEYPDEGGIRIRKFGTGGVEFLKTGLAKVELQVAGVSSKSNVDVVLVVDVSNSMAWSMNWFEGKSAEFVSTAKDPDKIPAADKKEGATEEEKNNDPDKLDMAMEYAQNFATTLLGNGGSGNTLSFVTFAGQDSDHHASDGDTKDYADSVQTVFTSVDTAAAANNSFANTKFVSKTVNGNSVICKLAIVDDQGNKLTKDNEQNRGNTNYDYAFGQAMDAVKKVKDKYNEAHKAEGLTYEDSGRELHVVFMTDGAPSHYNGIWNKERAPEKVYATLWESGSNNRYAATPYDNDGWLTHIGRYNRLATQLYGQITEMHVVGFDLDHGGYGTPGEVGSFSSNSESLNKVLQGLVQNRVLESVEAKDANRLKTFFDELAASLTYSATSAKVTDIVGDDFVLFTGTQGNDDTKKVEATITVSSYNLWKKSDEGANENNIGERKDEGIELESVTIVPNADHTAFTGATSTELSGDILGVDETTGHQQVKAKYFTYDFVTRTFTWNIGNVEDKEYTLTYWAYLKDSRDGGGGAKEGNHYTNKEATLDYVDINGKHASRKFPMPEVAWQSATVAFRFFLVDDQGRYVNNAGTPFTEKANRVFLPQRWYFNYGLDTTTSNYIGVNSDKYPGLTDLTAAYALEQAKLGDIYELYQNGNIVVTNDQTNTLNLEQAIVVTANANGDYVGNGKANLIDGFDLAGKNHFVHTIVDIPVVRNTLGTAETPLKADTVVMDYGLPMPIDVVKNEDPRTATSGTETVEIEMSPMGFVPGFVPDPADPDLKNYILESAVKTPISGLYGKFSIENGKVLYTPEKILGGVEKTVYVAVKLAPKGSTNPKDFRILVNPLTVIPATSVYYETDSKMDGAFTKVGRTWTIEGAFSETERQQEYEVGGIYGHDSNYDNTSIHFSNDSAYTVTGAGTKNSYVTFTFTGTGFDLISRTGKHEGVIRVYVTNADHTVERRKTIINTANTELFQLPVYSTDDNDPLPYGTYTVTVGVLVPLKDGKGNLLTGADFCFDAVRVYNTAETNETALAEYAKDKEANAKIQEIRDLLITADDFGAGDSTIGSLFMDLNDNQRDENDKEHYVGLTIANYKSFGPKNEVYLGKDNAIAFKLTNLTNLDKMQIGAKSADGNPVTMNIIVRSTVKNAQGEYDVYFNENYPIKTATAMFYGLTVDSGWNLSQGVIVVVSCKTADGQTGGVLSLTDLKTTYSVASTQSVNVVSDAQTYVAARNLLAPSYDVQAASFDEETAMALDTTTMSVVTTDLVDSLTVTDSYGNVIPASATYLETEMGERIWTVTLRTTNIGDVSYTVMGYGADGQTGIVVTDHIVVSY